MTKELWKPVDSYEESYEVSNFGRIRGINTCILSPQKTKKGYLRVQLYKDGKRQSCDLHRVIAIAFITNLYNKKEVNHIDNNRSNNVLSNLEWVTSVENRHHCVKQGRHNQGEKQHSAKLRVEDILEIKSSTASGFSLSKKYGVSDESIYKIRRGITWKSVTA